MLLDGTLSRPHTPSSRPELSPLTSFFCVLHRKLVIIGDGACGKTSLLSVFTLGYFPTVRGASHLIRGPNSVQPHANAIAPQHYVSAPPVAHRHP